MKRLFFSCAVLSASVVNLEALDRSDEVGYMTIKYGLTSISDNFALKQHTFAFDFVSDIGHGIKPKFDLSYVNINDNDSVDYLLQGSLNGYLKTDIDYQNFFPYYYGGLGYEYVGGGRDEFDSSFYFQVAAGLDFSISSPSEDLHLVTELRFLQLIGSDDGQDNEATIFIGLKLPFGETLARYGYNESYYNPAESTPFDTYPEFSEGIAVQQEPVTNYQQPQESVRWTRGERKDLISDQDGDGVDDNVDNCNNTPKNQAVDDFGCAIGNGRTYIENQTPVILNRDDSTVTIGNSFSTTALPRNRKVLNIHFELNSDQITADSREMIRRFVESVNISGYSDITVEGYTDSTGDFRSNINLSRNRANSVKNLMVRYGIDSTMISAIGKGAVNPLATNETVEGRAKNRRIELIVKP